MFGFMSGRVKAIIAEAAFDGVKSLIDRNKDGVIDADELKYALKAFSRLKKWLKKTV